MEPKRNLILDAKRSNAINIAMKKLPTPQTIKAAIMKMDATVIGREGIEKLLTMLPTEEEKVKIQEAQVMLLILLHIRIVDYNSGTSFALNCLNSQDF